jgi:hypothetical protein
MQIGAINASNQGIKSVQKRSKNKHTASKSDNYFNLHLLLTKK